MSELLPAPGGPRMIAACVLARLWEGAKATLRSPSLVGTVEPDITVPGPEPIVVSMEETLEPGESGACAICPEASLFDDIESLGSSCVPPVLVPPEPFELTMNGPREVPICRE